MGATFQQPTILFLTHKKCEHVRDGEVGEIDVGLVPEVSVAGHHQARAQVPCNH